jgi:hypothetical protein
MATRWKKSSFSGADNQCVEITHTRNALRDSKNPDGPTITADLSTLLATVRTGRLDR